MIASGAMLAVTAATVGGLVGISILSALITLTLWPES